MVKCQVIKCRNKGTATMVTCYARGDEVTLIAFVCKKHGEYIE